MKNILRSDFYRLFRSKAFYICLGVLLCLMVGSACITKWSEDMIAELNESRDMGMEAVSLIKDGITFGTKSISGGDILFFLAIFTSIFISAEFSHGTMKNVVSKGFPRYQIYLSKLITLVVTAYLMILVTFLCSTVTATILTGTFGSITGTLVGQILRMVGIELLLYMSVTSLFVMVAMIIRSNGGTLAVNILGIIFGSLFYQLLDLIVKNKIKFSDYGLQRNLTMYYDNIAPPAQDMIRSIIVGLAFLIVSLFIGILAFKKTDVK